jgi:hypothetical protein
MSRKPAPGETVSPFVLLTCDNGDRMSVRADQVDALRVAQGRIQILMRSGVQFETSFPAESLAEIQGVLTATVCGLVHQ